MTHVLNITIINNIFIYLLLLNDHIILISTSKCVFKHSLEMLQKVGLLKGKKKQISSLKTV